MGVGKEKGEEEEEGVVVVRGRKMEAMAQRVMEGVRAVHAEIVAELCDGESEGKKDSDVERVYLFDERETQNCHCAVTDGAKSIENGY